MKLRLKISMSLDGFVAGPDQSVQNPLGVGGMRLHEWVCSARRLADDARVGWRNRQRQFARRRRVDGEHRCHDHGPQHVRWSPRTVGREEAMERVVGRKPPVSPSSIRAHSSLTRSTRTRRGHQLHVRHWWHQSGARSGAAGRRRQGYLAGRRSEGGQQYLVAGMVDEMDINLVPVLLGRGERLFDGAGDDLHGLELVKTVAAPNVTHLKFVR